MTFYFQLLTVHDSINVFLWLRATIATFLNLHGFLVLVSEILNFYILSHEYRFHKLNNKKQTY